MNGKKFWDRLKIVLKQNKMTQKALAEKSEIPLKTLQSWIYRQIYPSFPDAYLIAKTLGVSMEYLLDKKPPKEKAKHNIAKVRFTLKQLDEKLAKISV